LNQEWKRAKHGFDLCDLDRVAAGNGQKLAQG
jgi:hypothetical protein